MDNRGPPPGTRDGHGSQQGSQQGDRRFAGLLTKGGAEAAAAARQAAGVPGPWEPVANSREVRTDGHVAWRRWSAGVSLRRFFYQAGQGAMMISIQPFLHEQSYDPKTLYYLVYVRSAKWFVPYNADAGAGWVKYYSNSAAVYSASNSLSYLFF